MEMSKISWTPELIQRLSDLYQTKTGRECAEILGLPFPSVKSALTNHKIGGRGYFKFWTQEKSQRLSELYPNTLNTDLALIFDCKESAIGAQAFKLRLRKTPEFMRAHAQKTMFKPGQIPPNKGQKMSPEIYEKLKSTMFKKGQLPHNTKADFDTSVRADKRGVLYRHIRVSQGKWIANARYVWEQANGAIPKGMCVWHKDYDSLNDALENLELITKAENGERNSGCATLEDRYIVRILSIRKSEEFKAAIMASPDLIDIKRLQIQLNRAIKEQENDTEINNVA